ncbi:MAG: hypothetical protein L6R30_23180 [Thermoanaerobaculia bacterium]|nr:hypothetical protein [Thermoanaerobaculia bacterium]
MTPDPARVPLFVSGRESWAVGRARYREFHLAGPSWKFPVAIRCSFEAPGSDSIALLDTGAEFSIMGRELADVFELAHGEPLELRRMSTRLGSFDLEMHRVLIKLLAEEGEDLEVDATIGIAKEPSSDLPVVLGYLGFLDRIRIALDPGLSGDSRFYFGKVE